MSMEIRKATTAGTKALTCLYAESGGGKTYSALLLARGLVGPEGRLCMIDTENRRGELYADDPSIGGYDVLQLGEPFSPKRYMEAITQAEQAGYDAIVIDSISHEWEGIGGVLDMAGEIAERRFNAKDWNKGKDWDGVISFGDWKDPKIEHKHLIQKMMRSPAHIVVCARAQYKSRQVEQKDYAKHGINSKAKTTVIRDEYQSPIQEERFIFEMTVHLQMSNEHPGVPIITKCPTMLLSAFPDGQQISVETGRRMAAFYDAGAPSTPQASAIAEDAQEAAERGMTAYQNFFEGLSPSDKRDLVNSGQHDKLKETANEADRKAASTPDFPGDKGELPPSPHVPPNFDQ